MAAERSFSTPLMVGSALLLAAILFVLGVVPVMTCPRCTGVDPIATSPATGFLCPLCLGKKKVTWWQQHRWRQGVSLRLAPETK